MRASLPSHSVTSCSSSLTTEPGGCSSFVSRLRIETSARYSELDRLVSGWPCSSNAVRSLFAWSRAVLIARTRSSRAVLKQARQESNLQPPVLETLTLGGHQSALGYTVAQ